MRFHLSPQIGVLAPALSHTLLFFSSTASPSLSTRRVPAAALVQFSA
jgi:hypothetical protein